MCVATAPTRSPLGPCSARRGSNCRCSPVASPPTSSISQRSASCEIVPGTSTSTGRPVLGAMKLGSTTRTARRMSGRSDRTQSEAFHSSITRALGRGICTRSVVPAEASMMNRSQDAPRWAASRVRPWLMTRGPTSASAISHELSGVSKESSIVAAFAGSVPPTGIKAAASAQAIT